MAVSKLSTYTPTLTYESRYVQSFDITPGTKERPVTIAVRSAMGTGKTQALQQFLARYPLHSVVFVSPRRSFARFLKRKFGFVHYQDLPAGEIKDQRVIIQAESLHRLSLRDRKDLILILDEFNSVLQEMCCAQTHRDKHNFNMSKFQLMIQHAPTEQEGEAIT